MRFKLTFFNLFINSAESRGYDRPLFAFESRRGLGHALSDFVEVERCGEQRGFCVRASRFERCHGAGLATATPWPTDLIEMVAAPIQRGRLFMTPQMVYGHLRDFRDPADTATLQAGSLCVVASRRLLVTGRRIPLRSIEELRSRVEARTIRPESPFGLIRNSFEP